MKLESTGGFKQPEWSPCSVSLKYVISRDGGIRNAPPLHHAVADERTEGKDQSEGVGKGLQERQVHRRSDICSTIC